MGKDMKLKNFLFGAFSKKHSREKVDRTNCCLSIHQIQAIFYDCDGVLTDNRVLTNESGSESVFFTGVRFNALNSFANSINEKMSSLLKSCILKRCLSL